MAWAFSDRKEPSAWKPCSHHYPSRSSRDFRLLWWAKWIESFHVLMCCEKGRQLSNWWLATCPFMSTRIAWSAEPASICLLCNSLLFFRRTCFTEASVQISIHLSGSIHFCPRAKNVFIIRSWIRPLPIQQSQGSRLKVDVTTKSNMPPN